MAQITINVPDDKEQRFLNAFATVFGWVQEKDGTRKQFMKSKIQRPYERDPVQGRDRRSSENRFPNVAS